MVSISQAAWDAIVTENVGLKARLAEAERDTDDLLRRLNLDPERYRTECGHLNVPKIIAAIKHPDEYPTLAGDALPQHTTSADCWCGPTVDYVDPDTGATVYVHHKSN